MASPGWWGSTRDMSSRIATNPSDSKHQGQELGGWESVEMVRRYAHLSSEHLAEYVDRMSGGLRVVEAENEKVVATI